ncbi:MAG TPA: GAF domain-containing protein [candidate division Zixibacteria bacterium]
MSKDRPKILVIDDETRMCQSLESLLANDGYHVIVADAGNKGIDCIRENQLDLVISDIKLPDVDGIEILRVAKTKDENLPVILMTGYASLETAIEAVEQGAYDYLMKPIEFSHLQLVIKRGLEKRELNLAKTILLTQLQLRNEQLQKKVEELNALYQAGKSLSTTDSLDNLLDQIIHLATAVIGAKIGSIMLFQPPENHLVIKAAIGLEEEVIKTTRLGPGQGIAGYVAEKGIPLLVRDIEEDIRFKRINKQKYETKSLLSVPLQVKDRVLGVINLSNKQDKKLFTREDLRLLATFASQAAIAIDDAYHFEEKLQRIGELSALYEIATHLSVTEQTSQVADFVFEQLRRVMPIDFCLWFDFDQKGKLLRFAFQKGCKKETIDALRTIEFGLEKSDILNSDKLNKKVKAELKSLPHLEEYLDSIHSTGILAEDTVHGILCIGNYQHKPISKQQADLISIVASQISIIYERQRAVLNASRLVTMGNMLSEISHDLKKPLTNIKGALQLLREKKKEKYLLQAEEEIKHLTDLVKEMVDFSNPNKYELVQVDIKSIVEKALSLVKNDLETGGIKFEANYGDDLPLVFANRNEILEMILNIILNALESMPQGGSLKIETNKQYLSEKQEEFLKIAIRDTGCGIPRENLNKIFTRYFTTKKEGTGLGLAIVDRAIKAHGGFVEVESELGKGTTVMLYLPLSHT